MLISKNYKQRGLTKEGEMDETGYRVSKTFMFAYAQSNRMKIQPSIRVKEKVEHEIFPRQNCSVSQGQP